MKVSTFFSIGILVSFFLPWVDLTFFELSGYNIPIAFSKISNVYNFIGDNDKSGVYKISYLLYLIPLCAVFNIIKDISKQKGFYFINEFLFGIIGTLALYIYIADLSEEITSILSIGFYLTAIFSVLGFVAFFIDNNNQKNQIIYVDNNSTISNTSPGNSVNAPQESKKKLLEEIAGNNNQSNSQLIQGITAKEQETNIKTSNPDLPTLQDWKMQNPYSSVNDYYSIFEVPQSTTQTSLQESKRKVLEEIANNKSLFESNEISELEYLLTKEKLNRKLDIIEHNLRSAIKPGFEQTNYPQEKSNNYLLYVTAAISLLLIVFIVFLYDKDTKTFSFNNLENRVGLNQDHKEIEDQIENVYFGLINGAYTAQSLLGTTPENLPFYNSNLSTLVVMGLAPLTMLSGTFSLEPKNIKIHNIYNNEADVSYDLVLTNNGKETVAAINMTLKKIGGKWKLDGQKFLPFHDEAKTKKKKKSNPKNGAANANSNETIRASSVNNDMYQTTNSTNIKDEYLDAAANCVTINLSGKYNSVAIANTLMMDISLFNQLNPDIDNVLAKGDIYPLRIPSDKVQLFQAKKIDILKQSVELLLSTQ